VVRGRHRQQDRLFAVRVTAARLAISRHFG
jgi:hypothetical protein